jgi:hypothetical protein
MCFGSFSVPPERLLAWLGVGLLLSTTTADAQALDAPPAFPPPVVKLLASLRQDCVDLGGTWKDPHSAIDIVDLNRDGHPDYVIDESKLECDGAASIYGGAGGSSVQVFASTSQGYILAWDNGAYGETLTRNPARLWLFVGGPLCGQTDAKSLADMIGCQRPLTWQAEQHAFVFAPLTEVKPLPP